MKKGGPEMKRGASLLTGIVLVLASAGTAEGSALCTSDTDLLRVGVATSDPSPSELSLRAQQADAAGYAVIRPEEAQVDDAGSSTPPARFTMTP